jgi:acetyltransferase-like isoleucine patch superfamily enzyme
MSAYNRVILWIKREETPLARFLKKLARSVFNPTAPRVPAFLKPVFRAFYEFHYLVIQVTRLLITVLYRHPLFQSRCATVGERLVLEGLPFVTGHVEIHIGNRVQIGGKVSIASGAGEDRPQLVIKDGAQIGWQSSITVSKEVVIEEDAMVSYNCRISDTDGHPREADLRWMHQRPSSRSTRPVRIGRNCWIGNSTHIMKGVTIGEGAIIGANSVVISDVPPFALALGNPAEVLIRNYGRPKDRAWVHPAAAKENI